MSDTPDVTRWTQYLTANSESLTDERAFARQDPDVGWSTFSNEQIKCYSLIYVVDVKQSKVR